MRDRVPYGDGYLPVWIAEPEERRGTILMHGGYDSCKEEFLRTVLYLRERGYAVYLFEVPGQGEVLRRCGIPFTHEWERPVRAVLDRYGLDDVTIVGISLGGNAHPTGRRLRAPHQKGGGLGSSNQFPGRSPINQAESA